VMSQNVPEQRIFAAAIDTGMDRLTAGVFAKIAYWQQIGGGVEIAGQVLRWRSTEEMAADLGYGVRSVTRALKALRETGMIFSRPIWHPQAVGTRVNGFRLNPDGEAIFHKAKDAWSQGPSRKRQNVLPETVSTSASETPPCHNRERQDVGFKYSERVQNTVMELVTLPPPARENIFQYLKDERLQEEVLEKMFVEFTISRESGEDIASQARKFWGNLSEAAIELVDIQMEPFTPVVGQRIEKYLSYFVDKGKRKFGPLDPAALVLWALFDPLRFPKLVEAATGKASPVNGIGSYQLGFQGYVLTNKVIENMRFYQKCDDASEANQEFLNQSLYS
jgi:hypothetical protein